MLEFTDKVVGTATVTFKKELTEQDIENIMVGALEGGIGYWAGLKRTGVWVDKPESEPTSTWATKLLLEGETILLYDIEDEGEEYYPLTLKNLIEGVERNYEERPHDNDLENADAGTCDCIIQYALFDEIVFG